MQNNPKIHAALRLHILELKDMGKGKWNGKKKKKKKKKKEEEEEEEEEESDVVWIDILSLNFSCRVENT